MLKKAILVGWALITACAVLSHPVPSGGSSSGPYHQVTGPCDLQFPRDHGPHPGYGTEWWYYTGNVESERGERFGFQLTFFRREVSSLQGDFLPPDHVDSAWRTRQIFLAHAALTDIKSGRFYQAEAMSRGAMGLAGAVLNPEGMVTVHLKNWSMRLSPEEHFLSARADELDPLKAFGLELTLRPLKPPVPHGDGGYARKGETPEQASCYYSFTRLEARGSIWTNGQTVPVSGTAWMDHEYSSAPLEPGLAGWDWFSLQLSDGSELMLYLLRRKDGTCSPASAGTFVDAAGAVVHLASGDFVVEVLEHWKSPHSHGSYPSSWRLRIPIPALDLSVRPNLQDQEMRTPESTRVTYWEGSVSVTGTKGAEFLNGEGYVELTGYVTAMEGSM